MWLINTTTIRLHFVEDPSEHSYAILSHTWQTGEVSFQEIANLEDARKKPGFDKIQQTCNLARGRGLEYAWVDTCCINKESSAELTEAINSMYQWYRKSDVCFAYLSDFETSEDRSSLLENCRWFTRGWTLQELIASETIEFYDHRWQQLGTKESLGLMLSQITGVDEDILHNSDLVSTASVAKRMSWASGRHTTRVEDASYCLFGLFDVHLPLIYGEGRKAFIRLQEAIISESNDLSIFAWKANDDQPLRGILANSPSEFSDCGSIEGLSDPLLPPHEFSITNKGIKLETSICTGHGDFRLSLHCTDADSRSNAEETSQILAINLLKTARGYVRYLTKELGTVSVFQSYPSPGAESMSIYVPKTISADESGKMHRQLAHRFAVKITNSSLYFHKIVPAPAYLWDASSNSFITDFNLNFAAVVDLYLTPKTQHVNHKPVSAVIFLGFASDTGKTGQEIQPWAGIYKSGYPRKWFAEESAFRSHRSNLDFGSDSVFLPNVRDALASGIESGLSLPHSFSPTHLFQLNRPPPAVKVTLSLEKHTNVKPFRLGWTRMRTYQLDIDIEGEL